MRGLPSFGLLGRLLAIFLLVLALSDAWRGACVRP